MIYAPMLQLCLSCICVAGPEYPQHKRSLAHSQAERQDHQARCSSIVSFILKLIGHTYFEIRNLERINIRFQPIAATEIAGTPVKFGISGIVTTFAAERIARGHLLDVVNPALAIIPVIRRKGPAVVAGWSTIKDAVIV